MEDGGFGGIESGSRCQGRIAVVGFESGRWVKSIEKKFGNFPLSLLSDRRARGQFMAWRGKLASTSRRQADYTWTALARIIS